MYQNLARYEIRSSATFQKFEVCFETKLVPSTIRDQMASELQDDFNNIGWAISIENNEENDESVYFTNVHASTNPNYKPLCAALRRHSVTGS